MSKRDRQGVRTPAGLEQKYNFEKRFDETMDAALEASESVKKLDVQLSQTEIFNRLTNNGRSQGVFIGDDGQIYINASYLTTGILKSLDGTTFYLDLVNGVLKGRFAEFSISGKSVDDIAGEKADNAQNEAEKYADKAAQEKADNAQNEAEKYADKAAQDAVNSQTQTDIFNKLTNGGNAQGIFYQNGQLYINASYLTAGVLKSSNSTSFYLDLASNVLKGDFTELSVAGRKVMWKENDDGTYSLIGT